MASGSRVGKFSIGQYFLHPLLQGLHLSRIEQLTQLLYGTFVFIAQSLPKTPQIVQKHFGDRGSRKLPDYATQLIIGVETDTMVDGPQPITLRHQDVPPFAVGVVDQKVEEHDALQLFLVLTLDGKVVLVRFVFHKLLY